jgi:predicted amidophosphoribosyltransferase
MGLGKPLGKFMASWTHHSFSPADYDAVIPIPLHHNRLKERGFNQSALLAREIARMFSLPLDLSTLWRKEDRPPQVGLGRLQRRKNTRGVFEVKRGKDIYRKRLLW